MDTSRMAEISVRRVDYGYFVRPGTETHTGRPQVEPCLGYLIGHPDATLLFDTVQRYAPACPYSRPDELAGAAQLPGWADLVATARALGVDLVLLILN